MTAYDPIRTEWIVLVISRSGVFGPYLSARSTHDRYGAAENEVNRVDPSRKHLQIISRKDYEDRVKAYITAHPEVAKTTRPCVNCGAPNEMDTTGHPYPHRTYYCPPCQTASDAAARELIAKHGGGSGPRCPQCGGSTDGYTYRGVCEFCSGVTDREDRK